jgi:hypothetical protein
MGVKPGLSRVKEGTVSVSVYRVLRRMSGPKRDEVTGQWRKLHNRELHNLYNSQNTFKAIKSKCMRWAVCVARMAGDNKWYKMMVVRPEGRKSFERRKYRREYKNRIDLRE